METWHLAVAGCILSAVILFSSLIAYFVRSRRRVEKVKDFRLEHRETVTPKKTVAPIPVVTHDERLLEKISNDLINGGVAPKKGNQYLKHEKTKMDDLIQDVPEYKARIMQNTLGFMDQVEGILKRTLSGKYPIKFLRDFHMEDGKCDFVIHWPDKQTRGWKAVLINCLYSTSSAEWDLTKDLDDGLKHLMNCTREFAGYSSTDVALSVVVFNFPIPESYAPFYSRHDVIFLPYTALPQFIKSLTSEIFEEQRLSSGFALSHY